MFAIKAEAIDPRAKTFVFTGQKTMYGGRAIWLSGLWWYPRTIHRRLGRLAHRRVTIEFRIDGRTFQTAAERLEIAWTELQSIQPLPHFWPSDCGPGPKFRCPGPS